MIRHFKIFAITFFCVLNTLFLNAQTDNKNELLLRSKLIALANDGQFSMVSSESDLLNVIRIINCTAIQAKGFENVCFFKVRIINRELIKEAIVRHNLAPIQEDKLEKMSLPEKYKYIDEYLYRKYKITNATSNNILEGYLTKFQISLPGNVSKDFLLCYSFRLGTFFKLAGFLESDLKNFKKYLLTGSFLDSKNKTIIENNAAHLADSSSELPSMLANTLSIAEYDYILFNKE